MAIQELTQLELQQVSGAGVVGNAVQMGSNLFSGTLNAMAPIWTPLSLVPGVGIVHNAIDLVFLGVAKGTYGLGSMLGGCVDEVEFHYEKEKNAGVYNGAGILSGFFK